MRTGRAQSYLGILIVMLLAFCPTAAAAADHTPHNDSVIEGRPERSSRDTEPEALQQSIQKVMPAIIAATVRIDTNDGMGSGTIIDTEGRIITSAHVIEGSRRITVTLSDGRRMRAKVLGINSAGDLALLDIDAEGLKPITLGDSDKLAGQQWVIAAGHPVTAFDDFQPTVSIGLVKKVDAVIRADRNKVFRSAIVSDTPLSSGSSGGGLFDLQGRLVAINAAVTRSEHEAFSVRISEFLKDRDRLMKGERFNRVAEDIATRRSRRDRTSRSRVQYFCANCEDVQKKMKSRQISLMRKGRRLVGLVVSPRGDVLAPAMCFKGDEPGTLVSFGREVWQEETGVARLVAIDQTVGVALLRLPEKKTAYACYDLNSEPQVKRGQLVLANSGSFLNGGIVGATHRVPPLTMTDETYYPDVIQIDLRMRRSERGAPIVNLNGGLLGMVVQPRLQERRSSWRSPAPYGAFVLPVRLLRESYAQLKEGRSRGERPVGFLGVRLEDMTESQKSRNRIDRGVRVEYAMPGSPAYSAGIRAGDIITSIGGHDVETKGIAQARIASFRRGDEVKVVVKRRRAERAFQVTLIDRADIR